MKINTFLLASSLFGAAGGLSAGTMGPVQDNFFNGFYIGGNVGGTSWNTVWVDRDAWVDNFSTDWAATSLGNNPSGVNGGIQGGFNWRRNNALLGIEADWSGSSLKSNTVQTPNSNTTTLFSTALTLNRELNWFGSIRVRAGIIADNLLLYATGGAGYADFSHFWAINDFNTFATTTESLNRDRTQWGGTAGVGAEYAVTPRVSVKAEALYFGFQEDNSSFFSVSGSALQHFTTIDSFWIGRVGLNWSFG